MHRVGCGVLREGAAYQHGAHHVVVHTKEIQKFKVRDNQPEAELGHWAEHNVVVRG